MVTNKEEWLKVWTQSTPMNSVISVSLLSLSVFPYPSKGGNDPHLIGLNEWLQTRCLQQDQACSEHSSDIGVSYCWAKDLTQAVISFSWPFQEVSSTLILLLPMRKGWAWARHLESEGLWVGQLWSLSSYSLHPTVIICLTQELSLWCNECC